jgi:hypothetical protein
MRAAAIILTAGLSIVPACGERCAQVRQEIVIADPDPDLAAQASACHAEADAGVTQRRDSGMDGRAGPNTSSACFALCSRVLTIIDQFAGEQTLLECLVGRFPQDPPGALRVVVAYRPAC